MKHSIFHLFFDLSSVSIFRNRTATVRSPTENAATRFPHNHKNSSELIDQSSYKVNSSLSVAESRQFLFGTPDLIPVNSNLVSPFDVSTFGKQLLPLINSNIKEKVKDFANTFNEGADLIEDAIIDGWRNPLNPLNPNNFKHLLSGPGILKHLPNPPHNGLRKPQKAPHAHKEKASKPIETYSVDGMMHDYGINGYKHFEESILRELEKQEERKVEATIHTLFDHHDNVEIVQGKPYDFKTGWIPVSAPTKIYEDSNDDVNSQIVSPLHTSIFGSAEFPINDPHGFHVFDNLKGNTIHSTYSVHEEEGESKVKPVKARIASIRSIRPSPPTSQQTQATTVKSRYRKRNNNNVIKTASFDTSSDSGASGSHDAPKIVNKAKRNPTRMHIQSFTTAKPNSRIYPTQSRTIVTDSPKIEVSTESSKKVSFSHHSEVATRTRPSSTTTRSTTTSTTTIKPSRNVPREAAKFVDKTKATGYRGSVKFGQTTTKTPL